MSASTRTRWLLVLIYLAAVAGSWAFANVKYKSLGFNTRDYPFYFQFATKLLDPEIVERTYSINPDGYNVFFFNGADGAESLHQSVHFEPIKYSYAGLYYLTGEPGVLFLFVGIVFFLPILYLAVVTRLDTVESRSFALLVAAVYVLYPSSLKVASYDLRPFVFLAPFFAMSMLSLAFRRPALETFTFFCCMFVAREEALFFGAIIIGYAFVTLPHEADRKATVWPLAVIWGTWLVVTLAYFAWTGYSNTLTPRLAKIWSVVLQHPLVAVFCVGAGCAAAVFGSIQSWKLYKRVPSIELRQIAVYSAVVPPLAFQFVRERSESLIGFNTTELVRTAFSPRFAFHLVVTLVFLVMLWTMNRNKGYRRAVLALLSVGLALSVAAAIVSPFGLRRQTAFHSNDIAAAADVLNLRKSTEKHKTRILADYATLQAFADYQYVYAYPRLPWRVVPGEGRHYPANKLALQALLNDQIDYIVVSKTSMDAVDDLVQQGGLRTVTVFDNSKFVALRLQ
jgi:hypothetical protein